MYKHYKRDQKFISFNYNIILTLLGLIAKIISIHKFETLNSDDSIICIKRGSISDTAHINNDSRDSSETVAAPGFWFGEGDLGQNFIHEFHSSPVLQWHRHKFG